MAVEIARDLHNILASDWLRLKNTNEKKWPEYFGGELVPLKPLMDLLLYSMGEEEYNRFIEQVYQKHEVSSIGGEREAIIKKTMKVANNYLSFLYDERHSNFASNYRDTFHTVEESLNCLYRESLFPYFIEDLERDYYYDSVIDAAVKGLYLIVDIIFTLKKVGNFGEILESAAENGHESIVRLVLNTAKENGIKINKTRLNQGFIMASRNGHFPVIDLMLKSIIIPSVGYNIAFVDACARGFSVITDTLLQHPGANQIIDQTHFDNAFFAASQKDENYLIIRRLIEFSKTFKYQIMSKDNVFDNAVNDNRVNIVRELLSDLSVARNISSAKLELALLRIRKEQEAIIRLIQTELNSRVPFKKRKTADSGNS